MLYVRSKLVWELIVVKVLHGMGILGILGSYAFLRSWKLLLGKENVAVGKKLNKYLYIFIKILSPLVVGKKQQGKEGGKT